ncbi:cystatin-13-like [Marmota monax]|uniref:cystatin-13-like n=1 Tax=Marmota monax TaxID=9995 RepID=UPI001EB0213C|nr:cystatin-13-like [Marmota monax]
MARLCQALLLLMVTVALLSRRIQAQGSPKIIRKFQNISKSYVYVQQALWYAMKEYNKASKDSYYFRAVEILNSQEQVTDSLEYYIEAKIARTMCKKTSGENENCLFQQNPEMQKVYFCTFIVRSKPWKFELNMLKEQCKDV